MVDSTGLACTNRRSPPDLDKEERHTPQVFAQHPHRADAAHVGQHTKVGETHLRANAAQKGLPSSESSVDEETTLAVAHGLLDRYDSERSVVRQNKG
ncbi:hypothetical protein SCP_0413370 [Sparassis crispa]|uniref:Uncharacterized protein n=1 Tax=Sparassis crispa TaxID=139825 RepID=A0A401GLB7_9APHY|nr:hypothetical protein SCP_0413370 [Sparassis crispa]GBE82950.1 hypothetical protein SCP_0413370 [Sparassis crispa]